MRNLGGGMKNNIVPLECGENPNINLEAIHVLQTSLGIEPSRDVIERAAFEISDRLFRLELALHDDNLALASRLAVSLIGVSAQIGLLAFSDVARDLSRCIARQDTIAIQAVSARLLRLGDTSLFTAVEFSDLSGL
jgi:hypothetical protein